MSAAEINIRAGSRKGCGKKRTACNELKVDSNTRFGGEIVVDKVSKSGWASNISDVLSITAEQLGMKIGMLVGMLFPVFAIVVYRKILKTKPKNN